MRGVARENHAAMAEALEAPALKRVDAGPADAELDVGAEHRLEARQDALGLAFLLRIGLPAELEIDAPAIVGLLVQQRRAAGMEGRQEPEAALDGEIRLHRHVGDEEAVLEHAAAEFEAEQAARGRARAVGGDHPIGVELVLAVRRFHAQAHAIIARRHADDTVLPAQIDARQGLRALDQILLDVILLQVDEGREMMAAVGQQIEGEDLAIAEKDLAGLPGDALRHHRRGTAEPVPDFQRALGVTDGAAADAHRVIVVEENDIEAARRKVDGGRQSDRAAADDRDLVPCRPPGPLLGMGAIGIDGRHISGHCGGDWTSPLMSNSIRSRLVSAVVTGSTPWKHCAVLGKARSALRL